MRKYQGTNQETAKGKPWGNNRGTRDTSSGNSMEITRKQKENNEKQ